MTASCVVYLCHPLERDVPGMASWVREAVANIAAIAECADVRVQVTPYDTSNSVRVLDLTSRVISDTGPIVFLHPVQQKVVDDVRERVGNLTSILRGDASSAEDVVAQLREAVRIHRSGEPHICRRFIVALLMMRKLDQERKWAGHNTKGFMWADDIRKGRGLAEQFADAVPVVLAMLLQHGLIIQKPSQGGKKYALNPNRRVEIYSILRERKLPLSLKDLNNAIHKDRQVASVRALDILNCYLDATACRSPR